VSVEAQPKASWWLAQVVQAAFCASLAVPAVLYFIWSWRWPLVGDASLIHYIVFLTEHGMAPYRDLGDMNMPGSFLIEMAAMHVFGMGDLGWRLFDFALMAASAASFFAIPGRRNWQAGLFASSLFIVIHGRDGLAEGGQRDLTMAVCLIAATAFLFVSVRRRWAWAAGAFGLLSGIAVTIKPTALPLTVVQLALAVAFLRRCVRLGFPARTTAPRRYVVPASLAYLVAPAVAFVFLLRQHALAAFLQGFHGILPYYASLGHRSFAFVLLHSMSPLLPLVLIWFALLAVSPSSFEWKLWERNALLAGIVFGVLACVVQQRALPYYRYPLLAFLLPLMGMDFTKALRVRVDTGVQATAAGCLALAGLCVGGFFLAPQSAVIFHRYRWWETDFISTLEARLEALGGAKLSGQVQCIDSISGCGNVLYRMRLIPATGVLSDFLLFGPDNVPVVKQTQREFAAAMRAHPPRVIVVTSHLHIDGPDEYKKLDRWPEFEMFLKNEYTLDTEWAPHRTARWWSREETPAGYRVYVLRRGL
jgi:hypothetical protein